MNKSKPILIILILIYINTFSQHVEINFNSEQWKVINGDMKKFEGREAFFGTGLINEIEFTNGIIEVDVFVTGERSYPGINFRIQSRQNYERFYIRPHRAGLYPDALQYSPAFNGIVEWQLCNGNGYTAGYDLQNNEWNHFKIVIRDNRANIYINDDEHPALQINNLKHGKASGRIGLQSPVDGSAYFSNLRYIISDEIDLGEKRIPDLPVGIFTTWEISQAFSSMDVEIDQIPKQQNIDTIKWQKVEADEFGLVDIGKYRKRLGRAPDLVFAKTSLYSEDDTLLELNFGYSDAIVVFLNENPIFFGNSAYQQRDPSFLGIIGLNDAIFLPLKKGQNELILSVAESFGGWGFICQDGNATYFDQGISKVWETKGSFKIPESVVYDPNREVLYISNFDQLNIGNPQVTQSISKVSLQGEVIEMDFIKGLNNPLGITISRDELFVAERNSVAKIKLKTGEITERIDIPGSIFLNDLAIDDDQNIYISDSRKNVIWKISNGLVEEWLVGDKILDPNAMYFHEGKLLFGNSGDSWLKSVDPKTKIISKIAKFPEGFIDGIRPGEDGGYFVSLWKGKVYKTYADGTIELIIHTENTGEYTADFEYIKDFKMFIIPTFYNNTIISYKLLDN